MNQDLSLFLVVEERFLSKGRGLTLIPDFDVPSIGKWENFSETVILVTPLGEEKSFEARFTITHFNLLDPSSPLSKRWRIVVTLPNAGKDEVPIGSKVYGNARIFRCLYPDADRT
jgi:hypothetical protein